jgi:hypothetical protein
LVAGHALTTVPEKFTAENGHSPSMNRGENKIEEAQKLSVSDDYIAAFDK